MTLQTGGLERLLVDFGRFHNRNQFDLCFVALDRLGQPAHDLAAAGFDVESLDISQVGKRAAVSRLQELLTARRIDVLHTHNTYPQFYGAMAARRAATATLLNTQHGRGCGRGWKSLWQFRFANRLTDRVIGVSEDAVRLCQGQDRLSAAKMECIWNGIDVDRFRYTGPQNAPVAISVARLSPEKDYGTLLRALRMVLADVPDFRLKLVGDGAERPRLERLASELQITHAVEFLGERHDVPELLRTAGFFVSSSKTEGISLTLLEAMAVGLPIVTTRVGGNPEIVIEGQTGRLVPSLNPDALAAAMRQMLRERSCWPDMAQAARDRVENHFNVKSMVRQYEVLYQRCHASKAS